MRQPFVQSKRGERERTRRGIKNVSSLAKRAKEGFVLVHTWPLFIAFSAEKRKNSLSSRFSVALTDISLITIGLFQYSLFLRAREHKQKPALPKKKRARTRFRYMENYFSRAKLHSRTPRPVRVSLSHSQKQIKRTPTPHHEKSLRRVDFCLSVIKEKNENESKSSLEIHPQKPTRDA